MITLRLQQFVRNDFPVEHSPTHKKEVYWTSALVQDRLYQLALSDLPPIQGKYSTGTLPS